MTAARPPRHLRAAAILNLALIGLGLLAIGGLLLVNALSGEDPVSQGPLELTVPLEPVAQGHGREFDGAARHFANVQSIGARVADEERTASVRKPTQSTRSRVHEERSQLTLRRVRVVDILQQPQRRA